MNWIEVKVTIVSENDALAMELVADCMMDEQESNGKMSSSVSVVLIKCLFTSGPVRMFSGRQRL